MPTWKNNNAVRWIYCEWKSPNGQGGVGGDLSSKTFSNRRLMYGETAQACNGHKTIADCCWRMRLKWQCDVTLGKPHATNLSDVILHMSTSWLCTHYSHYHPHPYHLFHNSPNHFQREEHYRPLFLNTNNNMAARFDNPSRCFWCREANAFLLHPI